MDELDKDILEVNKNIRWLEREKSEAVPNKTNHLLHLVLTILTAGLWAIVWIIIVLNNTSINFGVMDRKLEALYSKKDELELMKREKSWQ